MYNQEYIITLGIIYRHNIIAICISICPTAREEMVPVLEIVVGHWTFSDQNC